MTRRLYIANMISADGYFEGQGHDLSWHNVDAEYNDYSIDMLESVDRLLFGRKTWEMMAAYWSTEQAKKNDPQVAGLMNSLPKHLCSRTLKKADWQNSHIVREPALETIGAWKKEEGRDIAVFGSSELCKALLQAGLVDELRLIVTPVLLGQGHSLFEGLTAQHKLTLMGLQSYASGNILIRYKPRLP
jgi:dihydrofolate reductase